MASQRVAKQPEKLLEWFEHPRAFAVIIDLRKEIRFFFFFFLFSLIFGRKVREWGLQWGTQPK
jgi:hypothetical protein